METLKEFLRDNPLLFGILLGLSIFLLLTVVFPRSLLNNPLIVIGSVLLALVIIVLTEKWIFGGLSD